MPTILEPRPPDPAVVLAARIAALEARLAAVEKGFHVPIVASGTPAGAGAGTTGDGKDGSLAATGPSSPRLWLKIAGGWHYTVLT
jgi:hypothetical protein